MQILDPEKTRLIKQYLRENPRGMNISAIASKTGLNRNLVAKYLDLLTISGLVEMQNYGVSKTYFLSHRVPISTLLEFTSDYIITFDADLQITQVNDRLLSLLGKTREMLIGRSLYEIEDPFLKHLPAEELHEDLHKTGEKIREMSYLFDKDERHFRMKQIPAVFDDGTRGFTCILEDTTIKHQAEEAREQYISQLEFFSRKLQDFMEVPPSSGLYQAIGAGLDELIPNSIIIVNLYDPQSKGLLFEAIYGERGIEFFKRCRECGFTWKAEQAYDLVSGFLRSGKIYQMPGKLHYASFQLISPDDCIKIETEFKVENFYSIGLIWRGFLLGNITIILKKDSQPINIPLVETYARAASITLQRHIAEERLHKNPDPDNPSSWAPGM
ncbi:MAG: PAS domain S-box protein, partial [Methanospirillum sp.]|nr:PAS domain S-box protein [Methanospirillum sp.]